MASSSKSGQDVIISPTQQLSDPNERKNRVPMEDELQGLHALMVSNTRINDFIDEQVVQLQTSRRNLSTRFVQQQRELEATQSQLCETDKLLEMLLKQELEVKQRMDALKGLASPLRRFPVELLRNIFEMVVTTSRPSIWEAVRIASVCRLWREVALDAPRLWTNIEITPFDSSGELWVRLRHRIKSHPVELLIKDIFEADLNLLQSWQLPMMANLRTLRVKHHPELKTNTLLEHLFHGPYMPLADFGITIHSGEDHEDDLVETDFSYHTTHDRFPSLIRFDFNTMGTGTFVPSLTPTLSTLTLEDVNELDFSFLIQSFHSLENLKLCSVGWIQPEIQIDICLPNLKKLELHNTPVLSDPWNGSINFPSLELLYYDGDLTEAVKAFIISHPTIRKLGCLTEDDDIKLYAPALPNLTSIFLRSFDTLVNWRRAGLLEAPFPFLQVLVVDSKDENIPPQFEDVIRARCLPVGHPLSLLERPSQLVELHIVLGSSSFEETVWFKNGLLLSASREVVQDSEMEDNLHAILRWN